MMRRLVKPRASQGFGGERSTSRQRSAPAQGKTRMARGTGPPERSAVTATVAAALVDRRPKGDTRRTRDRRVEGCELARKARPRGLACPRENARSAAVLEKNSDLARRAGQPRDERGASAAE